MNRNAKAGSGAHDKGIESQVLETVRRLLPSAPGIPEVAASLSMGVRTLQRRLARDSLTYRELVERCRRQLAEDQLRATAVSVAEISQRLGYSDPAHFVRAFRRWTGRTPTGFRSQAASGPVVTKAVNQ